ncbi:MAG: SCO family protein [Acetobacteraceae bacterium]
MLQLPGHFPERPGSSHAGSAPLRRSGFPLSRRALIATGAAATLALPATLAWPGLARAALSPAVSVAGAFPNLAFTMQRSSDGKNVTAADFHGKVVILYFGFTRCPDICPLTMQNAARILHGMGPLASRMRVLFVTIDLDYDTLPRLKTYLAGFGAPPEIDGLRGTPAELARLAHRYAVGYKAPTSPDAPDPVSKISHSSAVYLFDASGRAEQILSTMSAADADIPALADDLKPFARRA